MTGSPSAAADSADSPEDLLQHLRALNINTPTLQWEPDAFLSMNTIKRTFDRLPGDFLMIHYAFEIPRMRSNIAPSWESFKDTLLMALCQPYRTALSALEMEHATKDSEILRLVSSHAIKDSEILQLVASHQADLAKHQERVLALKMEHATKDSEILRLVSSHAIKDSEILQLVASHQADLAKHQERVLALKMEHATKDSEILRLVSSHKADLAKHQETIVTLTAQVKKLRNENDYLHGEVLRLAREAIETGPKRADLDGVPATSTRAQTWKEVMADDYNRMEEILPKLDNLVRDAEVTQLAATKFVKEPAMYKQVQECFAAHLTIPEGDEHPGSQVIDTHAIQVINGLKPDLSIVGAARTLATATGIISAVELKAGALTGDSFGQLYDYLKGIQKAQPNRRIVIGLLSNLTQNRFLTLEKSPGYRTRCLRYQSVRLEVALTYLRDVVVMSPLYHPPASVFVHDLGRLVMYMGNPTFSTVGEFRIPSSITTPKFREQRWVDPDFKMPSGDVRMVVKRTTPGVYSMSFESRAPRSVDNEIKILRRILGKKNKQGEILAGGRLPRIIYNTHDLNEFGMLPRGRAIHPSNRLIDWGKVVVDVIDALAWLHHLGIIHRDVRLDNIVWDTDHAVLIDLGAAVDMSNHDGSHVPFVGGYVCCPPGIIGHLGDSYLPRPADDCLAVVLLVNTILFPARWEQFRSAKLEMAGSDESRILAQFWENLKASEIWEQFFLAACGSEYVELKKLVQFFVYL